MLVASTESPQNAADTCHNARPYSDSTTQGPETEKPVLEDWTRKEFEPYWLQLPVLVQVLLDRVSDEDRPRYPKERCGECGTPLESSSNPSYERCYEKCKVCAVQETDDTYEAYEVAALIPEVRSWFSHLPAVQLERVLEQLTEFDSEHPEKYPLIYWHKPDQWLVMWSRQATMIRRLSCEWWKEDDDKFEEYRFITDGVKPEHLRHIERENIKRRVEVPILKACKAAELEYVNAWVAAEEERLILLKKKLET